VSTYDDARIALDLAFKATDPERRQSGFDWLRQIVDGLPETRPLTPVPELPEGLPNPPEGFTYYGKGPLKSLPTTNTLDVACIVSRHDKWTVGHNGVSELFYALRKGSEIARLNGL